MVDVCVSQHRVSNVRKIKLQSDRTNVRKIEFQSSIANSHTIVGFSPRLILPTFKVSFSNFETTSSLHFVAISYGTVIPSAIPCILARSTGGAAGSYRPRLLISHADK